MNCVKAKIFPYQRVGKFTLYSVHLAGKKECEFDDFLGVYQGDEYKEELDQILSCLKAFARYGVNPNRFRQAGAGPIEELLSGIDKLRLYIIPLSKYSIIVGNGCHKKTRRLQETPACDKAWNLLVEVDKQLTERITGGEIFWEQFWCDENCITYDKLTGNLHFEIGDR